MRLEEPRRKPLDGGTAEITWARVAALYAAIEPLRGREMAEADKLGGRITHRIVVRHRHGIGAPMRFTHGGRIYDIRSVIEAGGLRRWLECYCEEHTP